MRLCKDRNIHTCIDTSGVGGSNLEELLNYTDLVMWDIKAITSEDYKNMVGYKIEETLQFLDLCQKMEKKMWIRQVIVPGINDTEDYINRLADFIRPLKNIVKIEFLPYELFGVHKYKKLGIKYRLEGVPAMNKEQCDNLYQQLLKRL